MKAAIYARYSSENQRPESIEDQVLACRRLAADRGFEIAEPHVYADRAASGARRDRHGLNAMLAAGESGEFDTLLVDDLSRLARDNYLMLSILAELRANGVRIISVADGLDTENEECLLGIQIRGIFNELQLRDLRQKTFRGQLGQKLRGFTVGERTFGYRSTPVGKVRIDKKGRLRPDGYRMEINPGEAATVLRIFQQFADGSSLTGLVKHLNQEGVRCAVRAARGWSPATITRMLRNEKYIGKWVWNRTETRRDPNTCRRRKIQKPESEWVVHEDARLRIVSPELWDRVKTRLVEIHKAWPGGQGRRGFERATQSRVMLYPRQLLSGAMTCGNCGRSIILMSGKAGGYYGCLAAAKRACDNHLLVRRTLVERVLLTEIERRYSVDDRLRNLLARAERELSPPTFVPDSARLKREALRDLERKIANFVAFIGRGCDSPAVAESLDVAEAEAAQLRHDIDRLERGAIETVAASARKSSEMRLITFQILAAKNPQGAALLLREVFGPIVLEPAYPHTGRPFYRAVSAFAVLPLDDSR